ncbi:MAG: glycosyltransferase family 4 protein [Clostridia bacterium]|nr:glycosyltransferase family 4 protein [Clostridia bacterium]
MRVLLVNKFLYPKGGCETYVLKLGDILVRHGHSVEYFGLQNEKNTVGNSADSYVSDMDFAKGVSKNLKAPLRIVYSSEARRKLRKVLNSFQPDVIHLNNIQFHLTPSIILEAERFRKKTGRKLKIIYTAHDYQLVCPSHGMFDSEMKICEQCLGGNYVNCVKKKCMKKSRMKSVLAAVDAYFWKLSKAYSYIDKIICPSEFLKSKLDTQKRFADKTTAIHNFFDTDNVTDFKKENYVLEFGHLSKDKGTLTLLEAAKRMLETRFVFAGFGAAVDEIIKLPNAEYVGFKTGDELKTLIAKAACSVYPSEWYENCPYSVIESQIYGTPVIGSRIGGIPELISDGETGLLFESGNADDLYKKLHYLLETEGKLDEFTANCRTIQFETTESYLKKLIQIYGE